MKLNNELNNMSWRVRPDEVLLEVGRLYGSKMGLQKLNVEVWIQYEISVCVCFNTNDHKYLYSLNHHKTFTLIQEHRKFMMVMVFEISFFFCFIQINFVEFLVTTIWCGFGQSIDRKLYIFATHSSVYYHWNLQRGTGGNKKNCEKEGILCLCCLFVRILSVFILLKRRRSCEVYLLKIIRCCSDVCVLFLQLGAAHIFVNIITLLK